MTDPFGVRTLLIAGAPVDERFEALVCGRQRLEQRFQLVPGNEYDAGLGVVNDEFDGVLSQRVVQRHAVHTLPIACLQRHAPDQAGKFRTEPGCQSLQPSIVIYIGLQMASSAGSSCTQALAILSSIPNQLGEPFLAQDGTFCGPTEPWLGHQILLEPFLHFKALQLLCLAACYRGTGAGMMATSSVGEVAEGYLHGNHPFCAVAPVDGAFVVGADSSSSQGRADGCSKLSCFFIGDELEGPSSPIQLHSMGSKVRSCPFSNAGETDTVLLKSYVGDLGSDRH